MAGSLYLSCIYFNSCVMDSDSTSWLTREFMKSPSSTACDWLQMICKFVSHCSRRCWVCRFWRWSDFKWGSGCQIKSHFNILGLSVVKKSWWNRSLCGGVEERLSNSLRRGEKVFWHFIILNELHKWTLFSDFVSSHARVLSAQPPNTPRASSWTI